jgi:hypothetical protein
MEPLYRYESRSWISKRRRCRVAEPLIHEPVCPDFTILVTFQATWPGPNIRVNGLNRCDVKHSSRPSQDSKSKVLDQIRQVPAPAPLLHPRHYCDSGNCVWVVSLVARLVRHPRDCCNFCFISSLRLALSAWYCCHCSGVKIFFSSSSASSAMPFISWACLSLARLARRPPPVAS